LVKKAERSEVAQKAPLKVESQKSKVEYDEMEKNE
jgi:hypothetical protein